MIVFAGSKLKATDVDGNTKPISAIGPEDDILKVGDLTAIGLLHRILKELKIMNLHLYNLTDMGIEPSDIEV